LHIDQNHNGAFQMVAVDWSAGAMTNNYITARNRVPSVGAFLARFVDFLHANGFIRFETTHIIGHSLGGHVCGFAGKSVSRGRVQVIMALDPAGPLFDANDPNDRTAPTDGVYVEAIHTNGGTLGIMNPIAQADFYPSFGRSQPGCGIDVSGQCAHARVVFFYAESVNIPYVSSECVSFAEMDYGVCTPTGRRANMGGAVGNIGLTGIYLTRVNAQSPFHNGV
jgi:pancreatic triacylglycerol lipase